MHFREIVTEENYILDLGSGVQLPRIANFAYENSLTGLEFASGIPGTIGGAVRMNAGAYDKEMKDIVISSKCINRNTGEIYEMNNAEHAFEYRKSRFFNNEEIILSTKIQLKVEDKDKIKETMGAYMKSRKETQPIDVANAGSTFKRNKNFITSKLVDECGLKGYNIGDAVISEKHAGFVINKGSAKAKDVLELIQYVKNIVYKKYERVVELEIEILGED